jgi:uncharacterized protein
MQIDIVSIPEEGKEVVYQEDPFALHLSPDIEIRGDVKVRGFLYKTGRTVIVKGTIQAEPHLECGRCSIDFFLPLSIEFDQVFVPKVPSRPVYHKNQVEKRRCRPSRPVINDSSEPEVEEEIDPLIENFYEGSFLSLDEMIREQVHLALPMRPLCSPFCKGLCPVCGKDLNHFSCDCPKEEETSKIKKLFNQEMKRKKGEE